ncbi:uncharacterized protein LOC113233105 isoform X2 [Hyposmocoma kahamanoa]|uniref:uncharacterized protein LOC113233105 isoform X2 n=1 Tax=Hyposmocoma kahamanoa TaxID=1477025 RepID=UPI000E6D6138|nr:uncharacterized protein LOC113233105 isoform X2 [Hyposmocoma kahamanoa]
MTRNICNHLCVFTLFAILYVSAHTSLFKRYVSILTPLPLRPPITSFSHLCLSGKCSHNSDLVNLNAYTTILRRDPRVAQDNSMKSTERADSTNWRQIEFITHEFNKGVRTAPRRLNTPPRPAKSVADFMETHAPVAPNKTLEKDVRIHIQSEFSKTLDKFERTFYMEKIEIVKHTVSSLPKSNQDLSFRWAHRLAVNGSWHSRSHAVSALGLRVNQINHLNSTSAITSALNRMVEEDSGGAMHCAFTEDELLEGVHAALLSTVYLRARWRTAPTLLNGTHAFYDGVDPNSRDEADANKIRETHMIRINDIMRYADLKEWDAQALEIFYSTPHLSFLIVAPRRPFLQPLVAQLANTSIHYVINKMRPKRIGVKLPIYTLRMTLLLQNKLEAMGISHLLNTTDGYDFTERLKISHAVQQLMFWAEAGRHAFKDDGIEWAEPTELELAMNRPYAFFLRWKNFTIANGNFVL